MSLRLKIINPEKDKRWDEFVFKHPNGEIYHHSAWLKVLESTFGNSPFYVALERPDTGQLEGILPFLFIKSRLTGKRLVSLPLTTYCSCLVPEQELENIIHFACEHYPNIDYVELKFLEQMEVPSAIFEKNSTHTTHILHIGKDIEQIYKSFHYTSIRQRIKRAERNNLKLKLAENEEDLRKFYKLHMLIRKKHGLPPHPYGFFLNMWKILRRQNMLLIPMIEYQGKIIAAAIVLRFKDTYHLEYSASDQNYLKLSPNQKLIWEAMKIAHKNGAKYFDLGRTSMINKNLLEFKDRWGAERYNLMYYYFPEAKRINTEGGIGRKFLSLTNRFLPLSLLQLEGKIIYPHLG